jgi:transcriptional regulator with XRE-family HTH domain
LRFGLLGSREVGDRLRQNRARAGVSLRAAADCVGVTEEYMGAVEAGQGKLTLFQLEALAELYGTTVCLLPAHTAAAAPVSHPRWPGRDGPRR